MLLQVLRWLTNIESSIVQLLPHLSTEMSYTPHQDRSPPFYGGELSTQRSNRSVLRDLKAIPEQGPFTAPNDVFDIQGAGQLCIGCDHDDTKYHERYRCGQ